MKKSMCVYVRAEDEAKKLKIRKENLFREILEKEKMSQWHGVEWGGTYLLHCIPLQKTKLWGH